MYNVGENLQNIDKTPLNFVMNGSNRVFINDVIEYENCSHLIADITTILDIPGNGLIEMFINSPGGDFYTALSIMNVLELAKMKGLTINTYVTGEAASAASMLALMGDNRYIYKYARHMIHFGSCFQEINKQTEIKKATFDAELFHKICLEIYTTKTSMKESFVEKLMEDEYGYMNAKECLKYKIATEIIGG